MSLKTKKIIGIVLLLIAIALLLIGVYLDVSGKHNSLVSILGYVFLLIGLIVTFLITIEKKADKE